MIGLAFHDCSKDTAASANGALYDKIITWRCGSPLVHVELVLTPERLGSATTFSSVPGQGCRFTTLNLTDPVWRVVTLNYASTPAYHEASKFWGQKYDWLGILTGFTWPEAIGLHTQKNKFCSEVVVDILQQAYGLLPGVRAWTTSPAALYKLIEEKK